MYQNGAAQPKRRALFRGTLLSRVVDGVFAGKNDLRNGYYLVALLLEIAEDSRQSFRRMLSCVVEKDDAAAADLSGHTFCNLCGADALPVQTVRVPYSLKPFCELPQKFYLNIDTSICKSYNIEKCDMLQKSLFEVWYGNQA